MKVVILAGGMGSRISEESYLKPKPMIEIGDYPILWHIMKEYSYYGFNEFIICLGYKGNIIKEYFSNYYLYTSDVTFDLNNNDIKIHNTKSENWKITLVDTGLKTLTAGRLKRIKEYIGNETFMLTYGDGVSDININELLKFHDSTNKVATITSYNFGQRFGVVITNDNNEVVSFREKRTSDGSNINAGYMVFNPSIFDYLPENSDEIMLEKILEDLSEQRQLSAYKHNGFWFGMDTQRDKKVLEDMWNSGNAKWKTWSD